MKLQGFQGFQGVLHIVYTHRKLSEVRVETIETLTS